MNKKQLGIIAGLTSTLINSGYDSQFVRIDGDSACIDGNFTAPQLRSIADAIEKVQECEVNE